MASIILTNPSKFKHLPLTEKYQLLIVKRGSEIANIIHKKARRFLTMIRVYFEKPSTIIAWKAYVNESRLDSSFDVAYGLTKTRRLLKVLTNTGFLTTTTTLDPITPQYVGDSLSWLLIGARTTVSQIHCDMDSDLSMPVSFINGTDGDLTKAINAMRAVSKPQPFWKSMARGGSASKIWRVGDSCIYQLENI